MRIVFDLDGTLADNKHREHFVTSDEKDWDAFFEACDGDTPIAPAIATMRAFLLCGALNQIEIWSGRGAGAEGSVREKTLGWLRTHVGEYFALADLHYPPFASPVVVLRMRPHGDYTPDNELKKHWLDEAREHGLEPELVFDDRQKVVDMWRAEGIPCFQVAPGDF